MFPLLPKTPFVVPLPEPFRIVSYRVVVLKKKEETNTQNNRGVENASTEREREREREREKL